VSSTCRVSFDDGAGVTHTVSVSASSLYEAAALAIAEFKKSGFAFGEVGPGTRLKVAVEAPTTTHELSVGKLQEPITGAQHSGYAVAWGRAGIRFRLSIK